MNKLSMAVCLAAVTLALGCDNRQTANRPRSRLGIVATS
jgi:hypothetical protein